LKRNPTKVKKKTKKIPTCTFNGVCAEKRQEKERERVYAKEAKPKNYFPI
jgi:hypothetical protein